MATSVYTMQIKYTPTFKITETDFIMEIMVTDTPYIQTTWHIHPPTHKNHPII